MFKKLKEQWKAECTKLGAFLKKIFSSIMLVAAFAVHYSNDLSLLPEGFVPQWLKYAFGVLAGISFLFGGFTRKDNPS